MNMSEVFLFKQHLLNSVRGFHRIYGLRDRLNVEQKGKEDNEIDFQGSSSWVSSCVVYTKKAGRGTDFGTKMMCLVLG